MNEVKQVKQKRVVLYVPEDDYLELRSKLIRMGKSVSQWFREHLKAFLQD